jgi:hypothetical protein
LWWCVARMRTCYVGCGFCCLLGSVLVLVLVLLVLLLVQSPFI